ncbi:hypothetical protein [Salinirussus salinus]|uniref:hypothetical protein n=1 Tax=Salinirussus salinus TaxID=1198300 RepID=UPI001359AE1A|nr:hypothetical protein [Salinirussus salinus]
MQRRAAAVYFVLFVLIGAGALGFVQVGMTQPTVQFPDAPEYASDDTITVDGRTHTVANVTTVTTGGEGGHGGGGGEEVIRGNLTWVNDSARMTATLESGSTTTYEGTEYNVSLDNETGEITLTALQNVSAILAADPAVEDEPFDQNGTQYVRYVEDGTLQPLSEYLPEPERLTFAVGDDYRYPADSGNVTATVTAVTADTATLSWTTSVTNRIPLQEGANVTLNGQQHFVHFPSEESVQLLPNDEYYGNYQSQLTEIDYFEERRNGVWGVVILAFLAGLFLLATAFMPVK